ncbi:ribosomal protein S5-alanine N-acetyltransferase [Photobacterium sp. 1_MG-2023]|uniref:ribosomal protein S5-alanine N-acetyltransferase n=1 Tax=Photobacterium sp. 1_MG-2023 TaxID=3062646 RepID=UPI0026E25787|nr:ribosomal protein S5-alanine N-acetyltransferase [Photobacterium sp. 1_MG-2023]MDO6708599.1 ribosomal protein S5-alanine N-acetyltransferase [Photobacterium sp. 1_MG-2023]
MLKTHRTVLDILPVEDAALLLAYYIDNQAHLVPWEPVRNDDYLTLANWKTQLAEAQSAFEAGEAYRFVALNHARTEVIGVCNFTGVSRGAFQACFLGYSIARKYQGQGLMQEILTAGIHYMFDVVGLNRVMANYMPGNTRSGYVLEKLGFEREGYAKRYLKIAGQWEDHILTSKIRGDLSGSPVGMNIV